MNDFYRQATPSLSSIEKFGREPVSLKHFYLSCISSKPGENLNRRPIGHKLKITISAQQQNQRERLVTDGHATNAGS